MSEVVPWRYIPLGEAALLAEAGAELVLANRHVLALTALLDTTTLPGIVSLTPALKSLLIRFDPLIISLETVAESVREYTHGLQPAAEVPGRVVSVPVVYGGEAGPDLPEVADRLGLTPQEVIALHCRQMYRVLMLGFAPGFPYLGPLPDELLLPRRATPRTAVPAGSVAIAAGLTGIYPQRLPGGWHVIGRTPLTLFDPATTPPSRLRPGDGVRFVPLPEGLVP